jgi:hypothetical protein
MHILSYCACGVQWLRIAQSKGCSMLVASVPENRNSSFPKRPGSLEKQMMETVPLPPPKKKIQLTSGVLCSLFRITRPLKLESIGCPKMAVQNYQSTLCNISEERRSHMLALKALVRLHMVWFRVGASCVNLR